MLDVKIKKKVDFQAMIDETPEEPRTLDEIEAEVGMPFSAVKVVKTGPHDRHIITPVGTVVFCVDVKERNPGEIWAVIENCPGCDPGQFYSTVSTLKAWRLLGHK